MHLRQPQGGGLGSMDLFALARALKGRTQESQPTLSSMKDPKNAVRDTSSETQGEDPPTKVLFLVGFFLSFVSYAALRWSVQC